MSAPAAIISGGTKGLGRELSICFAGAGYSVLALYREDAASAEVFARDMAAAKFDVKVIRHDVSADDFERQVLTQLPPASGMVTLINNAAAGFSPQPFHLLKWADFEQQLATSVKGCFLTAQAVVPHMVRAKRGMIINILSTVVTEGPPKGFSAYATGKYGALGLTKALAAEYATRGLKIFSVSPGYMNTPLTAAWHDSFKPAAALDPRTVAATVLRLALDPATAGSGENYDHLSTG